MIYKTGQYDQIHKPQYDAMPISVAHLQYALNAISDDGGFDIVRDHNGFIGPLLFGNARAGLPPAIHTLHGLPFISSKLVDVVHKKELKLYAWPADRQQEVERLQRLGVDGAGSNRPNVLYQIKGQLTQS